MDNYLCDVIGGIRFKTPSVHHSVLPQSNFRPVLAQTSTQSLLALYTTHHYVNLSLCHQIRPLMTESTALGAAAAAGRALRVWPAFCAPPPADTFLPAIGDEGM